MVIIVRSVFQEDNKYYSQAFLDECLHILKMLECDMIDMSQGTVLKTQWFTRLYYL